MKDKKVKKDRLTIADNKMINSEDFERLYNNISVHIENARNYITKSINTEMVNAYWLIGRDIVEYEQKGEKRAEYGESILQEVSKKLHIKFGRGFSVDTLELARKFYIIYQNVAVNQISETASRKSVTPLFNSNLSWSHYCLLMKISSSEILTACNEDLATCTYQIAKIKPAKKFSINHILGRGY